MLLPVVFHNSQKHMSSFLINFPSSLWGNSGTLSSGSKFCLHLKINAARITNSAYDTYSKPLIQTIKQLIESETAKVACKALHSEASDYIKGLFYMLSDTQSTVGCYAIPILIFVFLFSKRPQDRKL